MRSQELSFDEPVVQICRIYRHQVQIFQEIRDNLHPREEWRRIGSLDQNDGDLFRRGILFQRILEVHSLVAAGRTEVDHRSEDNENDKGKR